MKCRVCGAETKNGNDLCDKCRKRVDEDQVRVDNPNAFMEGRRRDLEKCRADLKRLKINVNRTIIYQIALTILQVVFYAAAVAVLGFFFFSLKYTMAEIFTAMNVDPNAITYLEGKNAEKVLMILRSLVLLVFIVSLGIAVLLTSTWKQCGRIVRQNRIIRQLASIASDVIEFSLR